MLRIPMTMGRSRGIEPLAWSQCLKGVEGVEGIDVLEGGGRDVSASIPTLDPFDPLDTLTPALARALPATLASRDAAR